MHFFSGGNMRYLQFLYLYLINWQVQWRTFTSICLLTSWKMRGLLSSANCKKSTCSSTTEWLMTTRTSCGRYQGDNERAGVDFIILIDQSYLNRITSSDNYITTCQKAREYSFINTGGVCWISMPNLGSGLPILEQLPSLNERAQNVQGEKSKE